MLYMTMTVSSVHRSRSAASGISIVALCEHNHTFHVCVIYHTVDLHNPCGLVGVMCAFGTRRVPV